MWISCCLCQFHLRWAANANKFSTEINFVKGTESQIYDESSAWFSLNVENYNKKTKDNVMLGVLTGEFSPEHKKRRDCDVTLSGIPGLNRY